MVDEASVLLLQLSGTVFLFICARHLSVKHNSELGGKPVSSTKPTPAPPLRTICSNSELACLLTYYYNGAQRYEQFLQVGRLSGFDLASIYCTSSTHGLHNAICVIVYIKIFFVTFFTLHDSELSLVVLVLDLVD